jgi:glycerol-3-phosphate acyltransferase PlsX
MDPRRYNGAMLLGLNGIVVKSHGGTDAVGFANAIGVAADMVVHGFQDKIRDDFERLKGPDEPDRSAAVL